MYFEIQLLLEGQLVGVVLFGPYMAILSLDASAILFSVPVVYRGILLCMGHAAWMRLLLQYCTVTCASSPLGMRYADPCCYHSVVQL